MADHVIRAHNARHYVIQVFKFALLILWAATCIVPLVWVVMNSFKSSGDILRSSMSFPSALDMANYQTIMTYPDVNLFKAFINSLIISGSTVILVVVIASMASFALGRFKVKASGPLMSVLTACLLVPSFRKPVLLDNHDDRLHEEPSTGAGRGGSHGRCIRMDDLHEDSSAALQEHDFDDCDNGLHLVIQ